jgi:hypothetical protein
MHQNPKGISKMEKLVPASLRLFSQIRGNANEGRLFGEFPMFMQGSQSRLSDRIASTLIKTQHDVAPGDRVKRGSMRVEECLPWSGVGILTQPNNKSFKEATATPKYKLSPFAHGYNKAVEVGVS